MKKIFYIVLLLGFFAVPKQAFAYLDDYNGLLKDYVKPVVSNGIKYNGVNYDKWQFDKRHKKVRQALQNTDPSQLRSQRERLAFWINAYNFFTIDLIIQRGERDSIKDLGGVLETPWQRFRWSIGGNEYTLDNIEHDIIRKIGDPRIHFAVNCAAKSCPDLRREAYTTEKIDKQLDEQVRLTFANTTKGFAKVKDKNSIVLTKVMDWYEEDFSNGKLQIWMEQWKPELVDPKTSIGFFSYDWSLNSQPKEEKK